MRAPFDAHIENKKLIRQFHLGDGLKLHVGCAFVDLTNFSIAPEFFDGVFSRKTISAEKIYSL